MDREIVLKNDIPAMDWACLALSPRATNTTFRWLTSALPFSRKNNLSTPYSWRVENLTNRFIGPARPLSSTKFFFPRTCRSDRSVAAWRNQREWEPLLTPSSKYRRSFRALSLIWSVSNPTWGAMVSSTCGRTLIEMRDRWEWDEGCGAGLSAAKPNVRLTLFGV